MNEPKQIVTPTEQGNALVTIQPPTNQLVPIQMDDDGSIDRLWAEDRPTYRTNFPAGDPQTDMVVAKCLGKADRKTVDAVNMPLRIVGYVAHVAPMGPEDDGEVKSPLQVVLVMEDGSTVSSRAGGVVRVLRALARMRGPGAWKPPVKATIKQYDSTPPRKFCVLELDAIQDVPAKKK